MPNPCAVKRAEVSSSFKPKAPVAALALPEFTTTARTCPRVSDRCRWVTKIGAAFTKLLVKTAPPTAGSSEKKRAMSFLFFFLERPADKPVAEKPTGHDLE